MSERKKGGGRKVQDEQMEKVLYQYLLDNKEMIQKQSRSVRKQIIKSKSRELTNYPDIFKASKGWLDKFCQRFMINID